MKFLTLILLSIAISAFAAEVKEATHVKNKYFYFDADNDSKSMSWVDALSFCNKKIMNLATIESKLENDAVLKFLRNKYHSSAFLGGSDKMTEGNWYWQHNRKPMNYTNWGKKQPKKGQDKSCMYMSAIDGKWTASYCDSNSAFARPLCEKILNNENYASWNWRV